ncbi:hypothetical protein [Paraburkholderia phytofirmans]|uniref:hypothetical protein n=1 Tax=Paraburkholderia TaxID=1822464 RepID=UPI0011DF5272|nr:hypothetical protein [Paraburkholderia phytofirmans]
MSLLAARTPVSMPGGHFFHIAEKTGFYRLSGDLYRRIWGSDRRLESDDPLHRRTVYQRYIHCVFCIRESTRALLKSGQNYSK